MAIIGTVPGNREKLPQGMERIPTGNYLAPFLLWPHFPLLPNKFVIACGNRCVMVLKYKRDAEVAAGNDSFLWK